MTDDDRRTLAQLLRTARIGALGTTHGGAPFVSHIVFAAAPTPSPASTWQSWTAANIVYFVAQQGDPIITGGRGGVTFWNSDGAVARHLTTADGLRGSVVQSIYCADARAQPGGELSRDFVSP
jgi:hypothetical protein